MDYLLWAHEERRKERGGQYSVDNGPDAFAKLWRDIAHALQSWPEQVVPLVSTDNWNIEALRVPGGFRRPKAYLSVELTDKGNLALEWYPSRDRYPFGRSFGDFRQWDNQWPIGGGSLPMSRIVFLHDFIWCFRAYESRQFGKSDEYLAQAIRHLLDSIFGFLRQVIDIDIVHDLYLRYEGGRYGGEFLGADIRNVAEYEREEAERKRKQWLQTTFEEQLGITAKEMLEAFEAADRKYATTANSLRKRLKSGAKLSGDKVKRLIEKLYKDFPEFTNPAPAPPLSSSGQNNVVVFQPRKDT